MANEAIREKVKATGVRYWEVAEQIGVSDVTLCRQLRRELPEARQQLILHAIDELTRRNANGEQNRTEKLTLTVAETARLLGVSVPIAYELAHRKDFPSFQIGGRIVVNRRLLEKWVDCQAGGSGAYEQ